MRVVLVTSKINLETAGGAVVDVHLKARYLAERGHEVTLVTALSEKNVPPHNVPYTICEERMRSWHFFDVHRFIYATLKKYSPRADVFYVDGHLFMYGAGAYRLLGGPVPVVAFFNIKQPSWPESWPRNYSPARRIKHYVRLALERTLGMVAANRIDAAIFTTPHVRSLYELHGLRIKKSHLLLDFAEGGLVEVPLRDRVRGVEPPIRFFCSGRMIREKGFNLALGAFAQVSQKYPGRAHLIMSGSGDELDRLKKLAQELGVSSEVDFPGWVPRTQLYALMDTSDVFILPHWIMEYSSVLLMEAMMRGLPVIVPRGGGLEWISADGGIFFRARDEGSLADAMCSLIANPGEIHKKGVAAKRRGEQLYFTHLGQELEKILREAAGI